MTRITFLDQSNFAESPSANHLQGVEIIDTKAGPFQPQEFCLLHGVLLAFLRPLLFRNLLVLQRFFQALPSLASFLKNKIKGNKIKLQLLLLYLSLRNTNLGVVIVYVQSLKLSCKNQAELGSTTGILQYEDFNQSPPLQHYILISNLSRYQFGARYFFSDLSEASVLRKKVNGMSSRVRFALMIFDPQLLGSVLTAVQASFLQRMHALLMTPLRENLVEKENAGRSP